MLTIAAPELLGGLLLLLVGLPFSVGLGAVAGQGPVGDSVAFGLTMVVPGVVVGGVGLWGALGALDLLRCRRRGFGLSLGYAGLLAAVGLVLIIFGGPTIGMFGALVLGAGTVLLSILPMPSIREDLAAADPPASDLKGRARGAM